MIDDGFCLWIHALKLLLKQVLWAGIAGHKDSRAWPVKFESLCFGYLELKIFSVDQPIRNSYLVCVGLWYVG